MEDRSLQVELLARHLSSIWWSGFGEARREDLNDIDTESDWENFIPNAEKILDEMKD